MKTTRFLLVLHLAAGLAVVFAAAPLSAAPAVIPSGKVLELHACELYTGGCVASSQSTLCGRSVVRAWHFDKGLYKGTDLSGLDLALLEVGDENLAFGSANPTSAVIYLPASASPAARAALRDWLKANVSEIARATVTTQVQPISFKQDESNLEITVGDAISLQTRAVDPCDTGACGESLWYSPRSATSRFTVLVDKESVVREPAVRLFWKDHGIRNVFLGDFGPGSSAHPAFTMAMDAMGH